MALTHKRKIERINQATALLERALAEELGVTVEASDSITLRNDLYQARSDNIERYQILSIYMIDNNNLFIVKKAQSLDAENP